MPDHGAGVGLHRGGRRPSRSVAAAVLASLLFAGCHRQPAQRIEETYSQAQTKIQRGEFASAEQLLSDGVKRAQAEHASTWLAAFQTLRAEMLVRKSEFTAAQAALRQIAGSDLPPEIAARVKMVTALAICGTAKQPKDFEAAQQELNDAQQIATDTNSEELAAEVEWRRGSCFIDQGNMLTAEQSFRKAIEMTQNRAPGYAQAIALGNLVYVLLRGERYDEAAGYAERFLDESRQLNDATLVLKSLGDLGICYTRLGDYDRAEKLLRQAEQMAEKSQNWADLQVILTSLGVLSDSRRDYAAARQYYERSLPVARRLERSRATAQLLRNLAEDSLEAGDVNSAARYNDDALALKLKGQDPVTILYSRLTAAEIARKKQDWPAAEIGYREVITAANTTDQLKWSGHAGLARVFAAKHRVDAADSEFQKAERIVQNSRDALMRQDSRFAFFTTLTRFYSDYIDFLIDNQRTAEALAVVDRSRAQMLNDSGGTSPKPQTVAAKHSAVLLSYWISDVHSYGWAVTRNSTTFFRLPPLAELGKRVEDHQRAIMRPRDLLREAGTAPSELYDLLVGPVAPLIPANGRVFIVADGPLHRLNFETLVVTRPVPHYWIEDLTVSMAPSISLLGEASAEKRSRKDNILMIGDPVPAGPEFPKLPNARKELDRIQQLFPMTNRLVFEGAQADPPAYRNSHPERFSLIHFAAHAVANSESPLDSAVALSRRDGDFKLYARDVMNIPLAAELVTISACRSAGARAYSGEGFVGFAWAFLRAGARNVIGGLWNVEDGSTAQLMQQVYQDLRLGRTPAEALRSAKLGLLHSGTAYRKPFYWGPFLLYSGGARAKVN